MPTYHGKIFKDGREFILVTGFYNHGAEIVLTMEIGSLTMGLTVGKDHAMELARHLKAAAEGAE